MTSPNDTGSTVGNGGAISNLDGDVRSGSSPKSVQTNAKPGKSSSRNYDASHSSDVLRSSKVGQSGRRNAIDVVSKALGPTSGGKAPPAKGSSTTTGARSGSNNRGPDQSDVAQRASKAKYARDRDQEDQAERVESKTAKEKRLEQERKNKKKQDDKDKEEREKAQKKADKDAKKPKEDKPK